MSDNRKPLVEDWQAVRSKIDNEPWAGDLVARLRSRTDEWIAHYRDDAARVAGWGHHYFCTSCKSHLVFDPLSPESHRCGTCGKMNGGPAINEAWNASYRASSCSLVFDAAILYKLYGDEKYIAYIRKVLEFFAENMGRFRVNAQKPFVGVFCGTNLMDAICVQSLLKGLELVRDRFGEDELARYYRGFFAPMAEFFTSAEGGTPNISCWMRGAAGMTGLFFGEREWCECAANGFEGISGWLEEGVLLEGCWYESSFHYHMYCAEALTYYYVFCELYGYSYPELKEALLKMYRYPVRFAFPDGTFPSPNDGWPNRSFYQYAHQYEWIRQANDEPAFRYALMKAYSFPENATAPAGGISRLLFGKNWAEEWERLPAAAQEAGRTPDATQHDPDVHYVMLRSANASVFFKYGFVIREHSHADVMNFELFAHGDYLSRDISNAGYGTDLFRNWQRRSIAHNTIMVDKQTQPNRPRGRVLRYEPEANRICAAAADVYPGVDYKRTLQLLDDCLLDVFQAKDSLGDRYIDSHTFDWFFHASGELEHDLAAVAAERPGESEGYQMMEDVRRVVTDDDVVLRWTYRGKTLTLTVKGFPGTEVYLFRGREHAEDSLRWGVMLRRAGRSAVFEASYRFAKQ